MSVNSRRKGADAENEVCQILRAAGWPQTRRSSDGNAQAERGDIVRGPAGFHLEVKRREQILIVQWSHQAEREAHETDRPAVIWRKSREPWRVSMLLDDWMPLAYTYEGGIR